MVGVLALAACGGDDADSAESSESAAFEPASEPAATIASDDDAAVEIAGEGTPAAESSSRPGEGGLDIGAIGRDVIIEMRVVLSSDDIERTVTSIGTHAASLGGGIASSNVQYGDEIGSAETVDDVENGYALLVVKVPPAAIDRLLGRIGDAGTVRSIDQSAQDVTEQLVDLDVRISNARTSVETVRSFMDRTEDLSELVALESELTRRQTELERLEAQQRNLSDRVALSTITVEVFPTAALPDPVADDEDSLGDALRSGWDAFVAALFTVAFIAAVLLPFLIVAAIAGLAIWLIRRRPPSRGLHDHGLDDESLDEPVDEPVSAGDGH